MRRRLWTLLAWLVVTCLLISPASATINYIGAGLIGSGTTSVSVPFPSSPQAGDIFLTVVVNKHSPNGPTTPPAWTQEDQVTGGTGSEAADSGTVITTILTKVSDGTETGNLTISIPSGNSVCARMFLYRRSAGNSWVVDAVNGTDATANVSWSVTAGSNPSMTSGNFLVACSGINAQSGTPLGFASESITATGATIDSGTEIQDGGTNQGNDCGMVVYNHAVSAGTSSAAPVCTMTANESTETTSTGSYPTGGTSFIVLREDTSDPPVITNAAAVRIDEGQTAAATLTATGAGPITWTVTGGADQEHFQIQDTVQLVFLTAPSLSDGSIFDTYEVEVTATNADGSDELLMTIRVDDIPPSTASSNIVVAYPDWVDWKDDRIAWMETHCPSARATTYHFANQGNDTTGDGSIGNPWATRTKAISVMAANTRLRFECGDTFTGDDNWVVTADNVTIDSYGAGAKPFFNAFEIAYAEAANVWADGPGNRWTVAETSDIAWVRLTADRLGEVHQTNLIRVADSAAVEATTFSWCWAANVLHINLGVFSPNDVDIEAVPSNANNGVEFQGDGCRVEGIRADGFGCSRTDSATQAQPFTNRSSGDEANYFLNLEGYFSGSHVFAHNLPSGSGGVSMFKDTIGGFCKFSSSGDNIYNSYSQLGDAETWLVNADCAYGTLKSSDWDHATLKSRGQGYYAHTAGAETHRLMVMFECDVRDSHAPLAYMGSIGATEATGTDLRNARTFRVNGTFGPMSEGGDQFPSIGLFVPDGIVYGERYFANPLSSNPQALENAIAGVNSWYLNSIIDVDGADLTTSWALVNIASGNYGVRFWHSMLRVHGSTQNFGFDFDVMSGAFSPGAGAANLSSAVNSIFAFDDGDTVDAYLALSNAAFNGTVGITHNAYFQVDGDVGDERGFNADPSPVTLSTFPGLIAAPLACRGAGSTAIPDFSHDINGVARTGAPTIGPFAGPNNTLLKILMESVQ